MEIPVNKYQTPLNDATLDQLPEEVRAQLLEYINIPFIASLISPDRKYAGDLPRDDKGRIIVDLCHPHILRGMGYFQPTANHYREHGVITTLMPNGNRNSEFGRWFGEEVRRCWYGYARPDDGEWIPGDMYFYLNYAPIIQTIIDEETGVSDRIVDFPKVWELVYLRAHYHHQARYGGLYNDFRKGQHAFEIAKRGASKSYYYASVLAKILLLGTGPKHCTKTRGVIYAADKEKLIKDGTLNKFVDIIDFCAENTQFPTRRLVDSLDKMTWTMGYKDLDTQSNRGTGNTVLGVAIGDKEGKGRGKRADRQIYEEIGEFPNFLEAYGTNRRSVEEGGHSFGQSIGGGCVCAGTKVWTASGEMKNIEDLTQEEGILGYDMRNRKISEEPISYMQEPKLKPCVEILFESGRVLKCSTDHPILVTDGGFYEPGKFIYIWIEARDLNNTYYGTLPDTEGLSHDRIVSVTPIGEQYVYNLTANNTHTYLANGVITHNTGGSKDANFSGCLELIYNPLGYNVYGLPNVFDKNSQESRKCIMFLGAYLNRSGHYNQDGVSDVTGAIIEILRERRVVKYNSSKSSTLDRVIAEDPLTIQEAILRKESSNYPIAALTEQLNVIDTTPGYLDDVYVGDLVQDASGEIRPVTGDQYIPVREFPHKENKHPGAMEFYQMPVRDSSGKVMSGRYIAGIDPFDDDYSDTLSLGSIFILDLFTDDIVFEYTGREDFADQFYEKCRLALLYYNATANYENNKKGLFTYFSKMNCIYLLSDVLDFLKDKDPQKEYYGNKAHPYSQKVWTPEGMKLWGGIHIGDSLFSDDGKICKVIDIPFDDITETYEVTLRDGRKVRASANHLWRVIDWNNREKILSTLQILKSGYYRVKKNRYREAKYYIPCNSGVEFPKKDLPVNPYFLGLMLGDGCFVNSSKNYAYFTSSLQDLEEYEKILNMPYKVVDDRHYRFYIKDIGLKFKELGLLHTKSRSKFIPQIYKQSSYDDRLDLLRGLLDTDGTVGYGGNPEYTTVSKSLAEDVLWVSRSLGINCNIQYHKNPYGEVYKLVFYTSIPLFNLYRKASKQRITKTRAFKTAIVDIKKLGVEPSKCVTVDSESQCYLIGDFVVTHNSKGTIATTPVKSYSRRCIREWLIKPVTTTVPGREEGQEEEITTMRISHMKTRALIKELINWDPNGNYDRHDALGQLMLLREDRLRLAHGDIQGSHKERDPLDRHDDKFFKNYENSLKRREKSSRRSLY